MKQPQVVTLSTMILIVVAALLTGGAVTPAGRPCNIRGRLMIAPAR